MALTDDDLDDILKWSAEGRSPANIARRKRISVQAVSQVISGRIGGERLDIRDTLAHSHRSRELARGALLALAPKIEWDKAKPHLIDTEVSTLFADVLVSVETCPPGLLPEKTPGTRQVYTPHFTAAYNAHLAAKLADEERQRRAVPGVAARWSETGELSVDGVKVTEERAMEALAANSPGAF
jgi:hypothetical protein